VPEEMIHMDGCMHRQESLTGYHNAKTQFTVKPKDTLKFYIAGAT